MLSFSAIISFKRDISHAVSPARLSISNYMESTQA